MIAADPGRATSSSEEVVSEPVANDSSPLWRSIALFGAIIIGAAIIGLPSVIRPMGGDHGNYAYASWAWLQGAAPYRDVLVFKPPMTLLFYAAAHVLFGHTMDGIRWVDLAWQLGTVVLLALFILRWMKRPSAALGAALVYTLCYYHFGFWGSAQSEGWGALPILVALLAATTSAERGSWRPMVLAGMAVAFAAGLKYTLLASILPIAVIIGLAVPRRHWWRMLAGFSGGFLLVVSATAGWLAAIGAWTAYVDHHVSTLAGYAEHTVAGRGVGGFEMMLAQLYSAPQLVALAWLFTLSVLGWTADSAWRALRGGAEEAESKRVFRLAVVALLASAMASTLSQGKFFEYHYLPWLLPVALMGGALLATLLVRAPRQLQYLLVLLIAVVAVWGTPISDSQRDLLRVRAGDLSLEEYWKGDQFALPNHSIPEYLAVVGWLRQNTDDHDQVLVWGREPAINYLAARRAPSRFIYNYEFRFPWIERDLEAELLADLEPAPPEIVVVASRDATLMGMGVDMDSRELLAAHESLHRWIHDRYEQVTSIGRYTVLRHAP